LKAENGHGRSKGCGIVLYQSPKEAFRAIRELNESVLDGRTIFVREDRETEASSSSLGPTTNQDHRNNGGRGSGSSGGRRDDDYPNDNYGNNDNEEDGCQLFVGNLSFDTSWQDLKDLFRTYGTVDHADHIEGSDGRKKGFGIVTFSSARDAAVAIRRLDGADFQGRTLQVRLDQRRKREDGARTATTSTSTTRTTTREPEDGGGGARQVYVGNLSYETSWQDLKDLFRKDGTVEHADHIEGSDGRKKGFGIVTFSNPKAAAGAIRRLDGFEFQGRTLDVRLDHGGRRNTTTTTTAKPEDHPPAGKNSNKVSSTRSSSDKPSGASSSSCQLFVGNLSYETSWQDLKDHFRKCGPIDHAEVMEGPDGRKKGFGILTFAKAKDAAVAIRQLDGADFQGRALDVRLDRRQPDASTFAKRDNTRTRGRDTTGSPKRTRTNSTQGRRATGKVNERKPEPYDKEDALGSALKSSR
jgi:RNA recognition motif-containing protein